jgi:hypothetical protein
MGKPETEKGSLKKIKKYETGENTGGRSDYKNAFSKF